MNTMNSNQLKIIMLEFPFNSALIFYPLPGFVGFDTPTNSNIFSKEFSRL
jgi:hypothetical protein